MEGTDRCLATADISVPLEPTTMTMHASKEDVQPAMLSIKKIEPALNKQLILVVLFLTIFKEQGVFLIVIQDFILIMQLVSASLALQTAMLV